MSACRAHPLGKSGGALSHTRAQVEVEGWQGYLGEASPSRDRGEMVSSSLTARIIPNGHRSRKTDEPLLSIFYRTNYEDSRDGF